MPWLCCTSEFNGDLVLSFVDVRLYSLWDAYVDHEADVETQLWQLEQAYQSVYAGPTPVVPNSLPELDCADYNADGLLSFIDVRFYHLWDAFVNKEQSKELQLLQMTEMYVSVYYGSVPETAVRRPEFLNPAYCSSSSVSESASGSESRSQSASVSLSASRSPSPSQVSTSPSWSLPSPSQSGSKSQSASISLSASRSPSPSLTSPSQSGSRSPSPSWL